MNVKEGFPHCATRQYCSLGLITPTITFKWRSDIGLVIFSTNEGAVFYGKLTNQIPGKE